MTAYTVVIPTVGRPSLTALLTDLLAQTGPRPQEILLVDDRPLEVIAPLVVPPLTGTADDGPAFDGTAGGVGTAFDSAGLNNAGPDNAGSDNAGSDDVPTTRVVRSGGRGPAAARNTGWRTASREWIAFLDDDVRLPADWSERLAADLAAAQADVGGIQGSITVPLPTHRRPTDWERNTAALSSARWATADMAYRRVALEAVHGFDERFPRAYREDADLALRVTEAGWRLERGARGVVHPARPADGAVSVRMQGGAASDALMRALHGPRWRSIGGAGRGRFPWHVATVAAGLAGVGLAAAGRRRAAVVAGAAWAGLTADFAARRIVPGPLPGEDGWAAEWARMAWTSTVIPWAAVWHRLRGALAFRQVSHWPPPITAVLLDRDGTLVEDVPYNGDPERVRPVAGAREALARLRRTGLRLGMVTNQSGVARGLITEEDVVRVNDRVQDLLGPLDTVQHCPHGPADACLCRKPGPGMVLRAAATLGAAPHECVVIGDIGADVDAARAAGAQAVLVPTPVTKTEEVKRAERVAADLDDAVAQVLALAGRSDEEASPGRGEPIRTLDLAEATR